MNPRAVPSWLFHNIKTTLKSTLKLAGEQLKLLIERLLKRFLLLTRRLCIEARVELLVVVQVWMFATHRTCFTRGFVKEHVLKNFR
jgi:hypothetical protein